ncbi:MAG: glycerol-3-phosphate acyltransferase [Clostridia bacterium]|nr:glycerol-3-phosphate acyltransferase [Clostridia bacterium]
MSAMTLLLQGIACVAIGYLLGNLSPSYLLGKRKGYDVRRDGSGNAGATNAFILLGAKSFFLTTALDILKAFAAYRVCQAAFPRLSFAGTLGGTACVLGHMYPALLGFRGGKGLASLGGVVLGWSWQWFLLLLTGALLLAFATRYVCLVAPTMSVVFPACYYW